MKENTAQIDPNWLEKTGGDALDMTLRDHFAGLAMQGQLARPSSGLLCDEDHAKYAYMMADAMLEERNK